MSKITQSNFVEYTVNDSDYLRFTAESPYGVGVEYRSQGRLIIGFRINDHADWKDLLRGLEDYKFKDDPCDFEYNNGVLNPAIAKLLQLPTAPKEDSNAND